MSNHQSEPTFNDPFIRKVNELIERANALWEERNTRAVEEGEEPLPPMLPLVRLKVGLSEYALLSP